MTPSTPNTADVLQVLQMTIDLDALDKYYHFDLPGRKPLCIVQNDVLPGELRLTGAGEPVRFVGSAEARKSGAACLEFSRVDVRGDSANVEFTYHVEGIRGTAEFSKASGAWRVVRHQLNEQ